MTSTSAIVWKEANVVSVEEVDVPDPTPGQVLVEIAYSLVSPGTEREWLSSDQSHVVLGTTFPLVPGYSLAGRVLAIGGEASRFEVGDRIVGSPLTGSHAALAVVDESLVYRVPDSVPLEQAVFFNLGMTATHTVAVSGLRLGDSVTIVGQGPIGSLATQIARAAGAHPIVAFELDEARRKQALSVGATHVFDPSDPSEFQEFAAVTNGGTKFAIDLSGSLHGPGTAIRAAAPLGTVVFSTGKNVDLTIPYGVVMINGLTLIGSFVNARMAQNKIDTVNFLHLLSDGSVRTPDVSAEVFQPDQAASVYRRILDDPRDLTAPMFEWNSQLDA